MELPILLSFNGIGISVGMGVFQVVAGLILYTLGSRTLQAAKLALLSLAEVLLGAFWVWIFLEEKTTVNTFIGGAFLLVAIAGNAISMKGGSPHQFLNLVLHMGSRFLTSINL